MEGLLNPIQPELDDAGDWNNYGIDWEGEFPFSAMEIVDLPEIEIDHKSEIINYLHEHLEPLS